jgi:putative PIN family toxin of toxin-antitoxin system
MSRPSAVLDTNVIISAHLSPDGLERYVLDLALNRRIQIFYSDAVFAEYEEVLSRPKFHITPARLAESLKLIRSAGRRVTPKRRVRGALDPDDDIFLDCAEHAHVQYLVTGNKRHFPGSWQSTRIVNAREFVSGIFDELRR